MKLNLFWYCQIKTLFSILFTVYIPTLFLFCILIAVKLQTQLPISYFTRDPSAIMEVPFYIGMLSNIGILFWCSSAAICLFSCAILRQPVNYREMQSFFLISGIVIFTLALDDFFLFHESVFPKYLHIPEKVIYAVYGTVILLYLLKFRKIILKTDFIILFFGLFFFGLSIIGDKILGASEQSLFAEDASKFLGIVSWFTYFTRVCIKQIRSAILSQKANVNQQRKSSIAFRGVE